MTSNEKNVSSTKESKLRNPASFICQPKDAVFDFLPTTITLQDGLHFTIRSITPADEPYMVRFHKTLSDQSVHFRYFGMLSLAFRTGHERLAALCAVNPAREIAVVADGKTIGGEHEIFGIGRLIKNPSLDEAEFAILVCDARQHDGLGTELLKALVAIGRKARVRIFGHILPDNVAMLSISRNLGFALTFRPAEGEWIAELDL